MKTFFLFFFITISVTSIAQPKIENGVSLELADYRKQILSNIHYKINLQIPAQKNEPINGSETIAFDLKNSSLDLQIDFKEQKDHLKSVVVNGKKVDMLVAKSEKIAPPITYVPIFQLEHITIPAEYLVAGTNTVEINFIAGDLSLNRNNDYMYTLLVPDRARTLFPCFDQPNLKATFQLSLTIPNNWKAVTNAPLKDSLIDGNNKIYHYQQSDLISTYLFSFSAGRFERASKIVDEWPMNFYYRETDTAKIRMSVDSVFELHRRALHYLEDYTQIKFPFKKFDFVGIPDFQYGGMEHVGAIDYRASSLFLDPSTTQEQINSRANLISHETSHMWFGDLVTMQWFNDVWMKEVFANFMADKITQGNQSSNNYELKFLLAHFPKAYAVDRTQGANPIRQPLNNLQEAGTLYGAIIYDKAPVMMRQLERLMGADAFRDGLREYLKKYQFGNATWPDLIQILDDKTPADLQAWNKVWVNESGRPQIDYQLQKQGNKISKFIVTQKAETGKPLPQFFEVALIYPDRVDEYTVNMNKPQVVLNELQGKQIPSYILFNSSGQGYGVFPVDQKLLPHITELKSPLMRASAYINLYENMLNGKYVKPGELMSLFISIISKESEELNLGLTLGHISDIYWRLIKPADRTKLSASLEKTLWDAIQAEPSLNKKKLLFRTYQSVALTKAGLNNLYSIWKDKNPPTGVRLSEDDYTSLALNLAVKNYPAENILQTQLSRITNPDRRARLEFLIPAVSPDEKVRDAFFASLKDQKTRKHEAWVADALTYLHHPLRTSTSKKYLKESLDMLQEIQLTGDIFFPLSWLSSTFGNYQTTEAANVVRTFLKTHPNYNPKLKAKILQAADPLFRAEKLVRK